MEVREATSDDQIRACHAVLAQLRPAYDEREFLEQIRRQRAQGYRLAYVVDRERVVAAAGFRLGENLAWRRHLYVDDLVTDAGCRSRGHGRRLLTWLVALAREQGCAELHLDSGVQRFDAHRFYLGQRMEITSHHFRLKLGG